ncbi:urea carboxylase-associated family protein [Roseibium sp. Sym1]|uniref:urea carboxylase-associated family protein n=1 Tax=Roseibium sp. Sym1 TaxID=3016006 RepID=UPI0022B4271B|nr:urea carboxylase-associated family protein [Roseibium sp. Sym1]
MTDAVMEAEEQQEAGRRLIEERILEPGTGKAFELRKGQVLRIEQAVGNQCVDFNCFNLHDYKEFMHCGRTRTVHGFNPSEGDFLWSAPPRENAMLYILKDTVRRNDVLFPRCSAFLYESAYGFDVHTNCHDIQAEAQREYGLTPDDVHDSFNFFMCTEVARDGRATITRQNTAKGDHVDLLAMMDVLAIPNVCGADIMRTSNFALKPVRIRIFEANEADLAAVPDVPSMKSQRTPAQFRNARIKATRELVADPDYVPEFANTPIVEEDVVLELDDREWALFDQHARRDLYGDDDGAAFRDILFTWWEERFLDAASGAPSTSGKGT